MDHRTRLDRALPTIAENAAAADATGTFPTASIEALRDAGLLGLTLAPEYGGLGGGPGEFVEVTRQIAAACGSTAMVYLMHVCGAAVVAAAPPPGLSSAREKLATGRWLATLAFSEKGSRSHFWASVSRAIPTGDGRVHVKACKGWVTSAGYADLYVLSCLAPDDASPTDTNLYALLAAEPGFDVAAAWDGLGLRANASAPADVDVLVSEDRRLGDRGDGLRLMLEVVLPWFDLGNAAVSLGLAQAALDAAVGHATATRFEHLGSTLADLPTIRARLARAAVSLAVHDAYLREAAARVVTPDDDTLLAILGVKAAANEAALSITDEAMRVCGGAAFSKHLPLERAFRDARAGHVMAPTADVLYDLYGRALCGMELL